MLQVLTFIEEYLHQLNLLSIIVRLALAAMLGGALGMERGKKGRPAGFRTYITVCVASALVMLTGQYVYTYFETGDPARLGAQVINGIGFLGAGTILVTRKIQVKGLTTAACLWASACIGLAIGIGFYWGGILCTVLVFLGMTSMQRLEQGFLSKARDMDFFAEFDTAKSLGKFIQLLHQKNYNVTDMQLDKREYNKGGTIGAIFHIKMDQSSSHSEVIQTLSEFEGLQFIEEIQ